MSFGREGAKMQWCLAWRIRVVLILVVCYTIVVGRCSAGHIIYVDSNAGGANNGSSWFDAYNYLQDALADANSAPKPVEIRVAQGVYQPDRNSANPNGTGDVGTVFRLINDVDLVGGYAGSVHADPNARDLERCASILSGDLNGNDPCSFGEIGEWIVDNSECIVDGSGTNRTAIIDGFVITRCAFFPSQPRAGGQGQGAIIVKGVFRDIAGSPKVANCTFCDNYGEARISQDSSPAFIDCSFLDNFGYQGGAMTILESEVEITGCVFENNDGMDAGAIRAKESALVVTESTFSSNHECAIVAGDRNVKLVDCVFSHNVNGGVSAAGSVIIIDNCVFSWNRNRWGAGAVTVGTPQLEMSKCVFLSNSSDVWAGALNIGSSTVTASINDCIFVGNTSADGGAIVSQAGTLELTACAFLGNRTARIGDMPVLGYEKMRGKGGCIAAGIFGEVGQTLQISNCTFAGNTAKHGSTVWGDSLSITAENSIVWDVNAFAILDGNNLDIRFSDIRDGLSGEGNVSVDPCFVRHGYWDLNGTPEDANDDFWVDGDYHLKSQAGRWDPNSNSWLQDDVTSPCIDAGDPMTPIGHEPFPNSGIINMGAYGGTAEASKSWFDKPVCETIVAGDLNGDCIVDFKDYLILASHWLEQH